MIKKIAIYLFPGLQTGRLSYKISLQPSALNETSSTSKLVKFLNFSNFCGSSLHSWIQNRIHPIKIYTNPCGSRSEALADTYLKLVLGVRYPGPK